MNKDKLIQNTSSYQEEFIESLKNPEEANLYLRMAMEEYHEDGDVEALLLALRNIADAKGGMSQLAEATHLNRQHLYNALSVKGNPTLNTFETILKGLGYKLSILPENDTTRKNDYPEMRA